MQVVTAPGVRREEAHGSPVPAVVDGMTALAHRLYEVTASPTSNIALSPLSIAAAFAMARAGARGETAAELDAVFGFPGQGVHAAFNELTRAVVTSEVPPPRSPDRPDVAERPEVAEGPDRPERADWPERTERPAVCLGNGLFSQTGKEIGGAFLHTLAAHYGAGLRTVDFTSPTAIEEINAWVREQTAGRIDRLFDNLDPGTQLVLANTVYLKAGWTTPFAKHQTADEPFTQPGGSRVPVPMMRVQSRFGYAAGPGWQAVELLYAGGELAMWVLVPADDRGPGRLVAPDLLAEVSASLQARQVDMLMPRWDFAADFDLGASLTKLGLRQPFTAAADFSGISKGLYVDQAVHRVRITVDEWGTEAAAVTGLAFLRSMAPKPEVTVRADHPFAFAVVHRPTRTPLFLGHIADPTAS